MAAIVDPVSPAQSSSTMCSYADNFWGPWNEQDPFRGFSVLVGHMKNIRREVKEFNDYFKERALIEEEYGRKLLKLGSHPLDPEGFGVPSDVDATLKSAFVSLLGETRSLGQSHAQLASDIKSLICESMSSLELQIKAMTHEQARVVEEKQRRFRDLRSAAHKQKSTYTSLCKELDTLREELTTISGGSSTSSAIAAGGTTPTTPTSGGKSQDKITERLTQKSAKLQKEIDVADRAYQHAVEALEPARSEWEDTTSTTYHLFEGIDMNRTIHVRERLADFVRFSGTVSASHATFVDTLSVYADCIKPEVDIEIYVSTNRTGYSRPTPMLYENHYTGWLNSETVFGKPLAAAKQIPAVIEQCIKFIEDKGLTAEGMYRVSGRAQRIRQLKALANKGASIETDELTVHDATSLLKLYLRELPIPLLTFELYGSFVKAVQLDDKAMMLSRIRELVGSLPPMHRATLAVILRHLSKVASRHEDNKMTVHNLAIVLAPGMLRAPDEANALRELNVQTKVVEVMIEHFKEICE